MGWALVAGGSKGIGYYIAEALAKRGYDILLIARNPDGLATSKTRLQDKHKTRVEVLACNLFQPESATAIVNFCNEKSLEIKILCHAAGLGGAKDFLSMPLEGLRNMVRVNFESAMVLSLSLIPILQKNAPAYILNVGSIAGFAPFPVKNVYSATKAALLFFSYSLREQLAGKNISVSCLCPGPVFTKPAIKEETINQLGWVGSKIGMQPQPVGEIAVRGMLKGKMIIVPGKLATLTSFLLRILPARFSSRILFRSGKHAMHEESRPV